MRHLIFLFFWVFALIASADAVRVGSYNILTCRKFAHDEIRGWEARKESVVELLKKIDADVIGLQEVHGTQLEFLRARLPEYGFVGERAHPTNAVFCYVPVVYRLSRFECEEQGTFWLSEKPDVAGSKSWDSSEPRVCTFALLKDRRDGRRFVFANTHLDHKGPIARAKGAALIVERLQAFKLPLVVVGDHNSNELEEAAETFQQYLDNAFAASERVPRGSWRTFNGFKWRDAEVSAESALDLSVKVRNAYRGSIDGNRAAGGDLSDSFVRECGGNRIDFIYVNRGLRVFDYGTISVPRSGVNSYPSDHFPVVATIDLTPPAKMGTPLNWSTAKKIRPGFELHHLTFAEPRLIRADILRVDLKTPGLRFTGSHRAEGWGEPMPDYTNGIIRTERKFTRDFMLDERARGRDVVVAFNSSPWTPWVRPHNHRYGDPERLVVTEGVVVTDHHEVSNHLFVAWNDGACTITENIPAERFQEVQIAHAGYDIIMREGRMLDKINPAAGGTNPRMAVGLSEDRRYLFILTVDGRQPGWSQGAEMKDLCDIFRAAGAADALNMDGGGSTTLVYWDGERPVMVNRHDPKRQKLRTNGTNIGIYVRDS